MRAEAISCRVSRPKVDDWDASYSHRFAVPDSLEWLARAATRSQTFHERHASRAATDLPYGDGQRQTYDVYEPDGASKGTLVFVHGGYWRMTSKEDYRVFAAGAIDVGWRVVLIEYPLCPAVRVGDISGLVVKAIDHVFRRFPDDPVTLSGHSAGGQLACFAMTAASGLSAPARSRIERVVSLSGVHDLRPLLGTRDLNGTLQMDEAEAATFSPVLLRPSLDFDLYCVCGADELPEFRRLNALLANIWAGLGLATESLECNARNHFTLLDLMVEPESVLTGILTGSPIAQVAVSPSSISDR